MASYERSDGSEEWYTPAWIFEALGVEFYMDPCAGQSATPCRVHNRAGGGLSIPWLDSVWLNPPFGGKRNAIAPWLRKFIEHGQGIAIVPNRTATPWFQEFAAGCDELLFMKGKVRFVRPDGTAGPSPGFGNVLGSVGMGDVLHDCPIEGLRFRP